MCVQAHMQTQFPTPLTAALMLKLTMETAQALVLISFHTKITPSMASVWSHQDIQLTVKVFIPCTIQVQEDRQISTITRLQAQQVLKMMLSVCFIFTHPTVVLIRELSLSLRWLQGLTQSLKLSCFDITPKQRLLKKRLICQTARNTQ